MTSVVRFCLVAAFGAAIVLGAPSTSFAQG